MLIPLIIACALFMENLDSAVLSTALPAISQDLGVDPIALKLAFTSYLLSIAVFTPISGWCADRYGSRTVFRTAIVIFTAGSALCGFASSLEGFIGARVVQGLGGAMMVPVGRLVLLRSVERKDYVRALSWLTIPGLLGPVMGAPLGGFITTYFEWRWIFWINIPIGVFGFVLATIFIRNFREENPPPLDGAGFLLSALGMTGLVFGVAVSGVGMLAGWIEMLIIFGGAGFLALYARHAFRTPHPLVDLRILNVQTYRVSVMAGSVFRVAIGGWPFLLPLMLQLGFGKTPMESGLLTMAGAAGALSMKFAAPPLLRRYGFRKVLTVNAFLTAVSLGLYGAMTVETPAFLIFGLIFAGGFLRSLQFTAFNAMAYADLPNNRMSQGTSLSSVMQQVSIAGGVTLAALLLELSRGLDGRTALAVADFSFAFVILAGLALFCAPLVLRLPPSAGENVSGHQENPRNAKLPHLREPPH